MIDIPYFAFLGAVALATTFFSTFNAPQVRGFRNIGFLAAYAGSIAWIFFAGIWPVVLAWCCFGIVTGASYYIYELFSVARSGEVPKNWPAPMTIVHGLVIWPIMLPEVAEYFLADVGILKASQVPSPELKESAQTEAIPDLDTTR